MLLEKTRFLYRVIDPVKIQMTVDLNTFTIRNFNKFII